MCLAISYIHALLNKRVSHAALIFHPLMTRIDYILKTIVCNPKRSVTTATPALLEKSPLEWGFRGVSLSQQLPWYLIQCIGFAYVDELKVALGHSYDGDFVGNGEVEIDDGKTGGP